MFRYARAKQEFFVPKLSCARNRSSLEERSGQLETTRLGFSPPDSVTNELMDVGYVTHRELSAACDWLCSSLMAGTNTSHLCLLPIGAG